MSCTKCVCLINTISLVAVLYLLLVVICTECYFYYIKHLSKQHLTASKLNWKKFNVKNAL